MKTIYIGPSGFEEAVRIAAADLNEPLFRGLGYQAEKDYSQDSVLKPQAGSLSVGTGVFFTNDPNYAKRFAEKRVLVTSRQILDPTESVVDTRISGYEKTAKKRLVKQSENYDPYELWDEVLKDDTICSETGLGTDAYVFVKRNPVERRNIIAEIVLEPQAVLA